MKIASLIIILFFATNVNAQLTKVDLQASGLTCSMCSNSINKSLKTLDFVDKVDANIKNSTFEITFKPNAKVDFDKIKKKVEDAGFTVANFSANYKFNNVQIKNEQHVMIGEKTFMFLNVTSQQLNGEKTIRIIDKGFVSAKDFKKNTAFTQMQCYKTGYAAACCTKDGLVTGTRVYHATI
ncbi:MAG: heavy-metal-associated domain-containing protein [Chitinophagaceae bacterium]|nr:heavy-metal-associated domain-containing protein [Chitinophagaceae bacterium]